MVWALPMKSTLVMASLVACRVAAVQLQGWGPAPADAVALVQLTLNNHSAFVQLTLSNHTAGEAAALARGSKGCCCYVRSRCNQKLDCVALRENGNDGCPTATLHHHEFVKAETCYQRVMGYGPIGQAASAVKTSHPAYDVADFCQDPVLYDWINSFAGNVFLKYDENKDHKLSTDELGSAFDHIKKELLKKYAASPSGIETLTPERLRNGHGDAIHRHDLVLLLMRAVTSLLDKDSGASTDYEDSPKSTSSASNSTLAKQEDPTYDWINGLVGRVFPQFDENKDYKLSATELAAALAHILEELRNKYGASTSGLTPEGLKAGIEAQLKLPGDGQGGAISRDALVLALMGAVKSLLPMPDKDNTDSSNAVDPKLINDNVDSAFNDVVKDGGQELHPKVIVESKDNIKQKVEDELNINVPKKDDLVNEGADVVKQDRTDSSNAIGVEKIKDIVDSKPGNVGEVGGQKLNPEDIVKSEDKNKQKVTKDDLAKKVPGVVQKKVVKQDKKTSSLMNPTKSSASRDAETAMQYGGKKYNGKTDPATLQKIYEESKARYEEQLAESSNKKGGSKSKGGRKDGKSMTRAAAKPSKYFPWLRNLRRVLRAMKRSRA